LRKRGLEEKRGHSRIRHGDGTTMASLDLRHHISARKPRDDGTGLRLRIKSVLQMLPRRTMKPLLHRKRHEPVIGWVKLHPVFPMAETIKTLENRQIGIGLPPEIQHLRRTNLGSKS